MKNQYKPEGYNSVSPYLLVKDAAGTIEFLKKVFGAKELRKHSGPEGRILHAEVKIDDTVIMMGESDNATPAHVHVYVQDVDASYKHALEVGGESVQEPVKKEDEDKRGGVKDVGGTTWWIGTKVE